MRRNTFSRNDAEGRPLWRATFECGLLNPLEMPGAQRQAPAPA
jgi:hypothetical protein